VATVCILKILVPALGSVIAKQQRQSPLAIDDEEQWRNTVLSQTLLQQYQLQHA